VIIKRTLAVAASLLVAGLAFGQVGPLAVEEAKLTATDAVTNNLFGISVAISGDTAVVGATPEHSYSGYAYVSVRSGTGWIQQAKLIASDTSPGNYFGYSLAISGDTAVVGARGDSLYTGAAYVFVRSGTIWVQQAKLTASDASSGDLFGCSVSIWGDTVVVGACDEDPAGVPAAGSAYVFVRSGISWSEQAKVTASDPDNGDYFGFDVALAGDTAVVGAPEKYSGSGSAYVFVRSGASWVQQTKLSSFSLNGFSVGTKSYFGYSVAISGDTAVVGAYGNGGNIGAAYVFERGATDWLQQTKLTASDTAPAADYFGYSVALSGDTAVVGAYGDNLSSGIDDAGSAYLFVRSGTSWSEQAKLTASDAAEEDRFGNAVALEGDTVVVGAARDNNAGGPDAGSAYVFRYSEVGSWGDLGLGLAGGTGLPTLVGTGTLLAGLPVTLSLAHAKPFSLAPLVVGLSSVSAPFKGGTMVPYPNYIFPAFTDFFGKSTFGGLWPPGVPSGFKTYFQWWIQDPAGPQGYAASNAVAGTAP